jgi:two-component system, NarL family, invasion response regulator UvrY
LIRVVIIDDHALVRDGLRRMLTASGSIEVVGEAESGADALDLVARARPDVLLLDLSMPGRDGFQTLAELAANDEPPRVLVLTMYSDLQYAERTLSAGAAGFIGKGVSFEELVRAVTDVHRGARYLPPELESQLANGPLRPAPRPEKLQALTSREQEVLRMLASGLTNREIAMRLGLSVKTVDSHRGHMLKKLRLRNNADLTRYAIRHRLIPC